jgi:hypothetical protein
MIEDFQENARQHFIEERVHHNHVNNIVSAFVLYHTIPK